jgi:hypothetical protein
MRIEIRSIGSFFKLLKTSILITIGMSFIISLFVITPLKYLNLFPDLRNVNLSPLNLLKVSLFVPIVEELIFRLPLRYSKTNLISSFGLILYLIFQNINSIVALIFLILSFGFIITNFHNKLDNKLIGNVFYTRFYLWIFYTQAIIFGFLHLANYNLDFRYFYLFPFFISIYVLIGCFWGYIRVRYKNGIFICIVTHMIINGTYCLIMIK